MENKNTRHLDTVAAQSDVKKLVQAALDLALINAAVEGDVDAIRMALSQGADAKAADKGGFTALMWAARYDLPSAAQALMPSSSLSQVDAQGRTALDIAREGAGKTSRSAGIIEAYQWAQSELAALSGSSGPAFKVKPRQYRL